MTSVDHSHQGEEGDVKDKVEEREGPKSDVASEERGIEQACEGSTITINGVEYICYPPVLTKEELKERDRIVRMAPAWRKKAS